MKLSTLIHKTGALLAGHGRRGGEPDFTKIRAAIREKYAKVSRSAEGMFQYPVGRKGAEALGYEDTVLQTAADGMLEAFCGVGNPFSLGGIAKGETVLDAGCGAGFDLYVASRLVGAAGKVCGLDFTSEMVERARHNLSAAKVANQEIRVASLEEVPFGDSQFDVVISNGVLNLSPCKGKALQEIYRVLKAGGRFQFADVVLKEELPANMAGNAESWSQ